jgi:aspartate/methionine/tyrosine aminotransferase
LQKLDAIAERAKSLLSTNRAVLQKFFEQSVQLEVVMPLAGTIAFPRLKKGNVDRFCKLLVENYETGVVPGRFFGMPDHFRIGIGCTTETLAAGLERLDLALREHKF